MYYTNVSEIILQLNLARKMAAIVISKPPAFKINVFAITIQ